MHIRSFSAAAIACAIALSAAPASAQPTMQVGNVLRNSGEPYTMARESQAKTVFVGGTWWGVFASTTGSDFFRFDASAKSWTKVVFPGSHVTDDPNSLADVKWDGANLVVLHSKGNGVGTLWVSAYSFANGSFSILPGFPANVSPNSGSDYAVIKEYVIAEDSTGRLWVGYANQTNYIVKCSRGTGPSGWTSWNAPIFMGNSSTGIDGDLGAMGLVAFGSGTDAKIGFMWTECFAAPNNHTKFRWRLDSSSALDGSAWSAVELCQEDSVNPLLTDDHLSVRAFEGQVWAASKTEYASTDAGKPRFTLMRRDLNGNWSHWTIKTIASGADYSTRPICVIDAANRKVWCLWHNNGVQYDTTPIDSPGAFSSIQQSILPSGGGTWDTSSASVPVDSSTGLMILADTPSDGWTFWQLISLGSAPPPQPVLTTITVAPNPASTTTGGQVQLTATGRDQNGNVMPFTPTWSATGGTITSSGLYTAGSTAGTFQATASSGSVSGSATVNVTQPTGPIATIAVSPNPASATTGGSAQFSAQAFDSNGNAVATTFTWAATGGTISSAGLYTAGSTAGAFDVSAASSGVTGHATVNVTSPPPTTEVIVDDSDAGFSVVSGTWNVHFTPFRFGSTNHTFDGTGSGVAQWKPSLASGSYDVYAWWPSRSSNSTNIPYTIVTTGGNQTVLVNQADSTTWGKWNKLGTYTLDSTAAVQIGSTDAQDAAADAVRFVSTGAPPPPPPPPGPITTITVTPNPASTSVGGVVQFSAKATDANGNAVATTFTWAAQGGTIDQTGQYTAGELPGTFDVSASSSGITGHATVNVTAGSPPPPTGTEVIVDDSDAGFSILSGVWGTHFSPYRYGSTNHTFDGTGSGVAQWKPSLASGTYDVYAWWPSRYSTSTGIPYTIVTTSGNVVVTVNQADSSTWGKWNFLGTVTLDASTAAVQIGSTDAQDAAADAVRFVAH